MPYRLAIAQFLWWRMTGSNRRPSACKADALPAELILHLMVTRTGFEPVYACVKGMCVKPLHQRAIKSFNGAPKRSRTPNLLIRSQTLYPIELWALFSWCLGPESNRHGCHHPQDFKSCASTSSATQAHHSLNYLEAPIGFEPMIRELQSHALPLGYGALYGAGEENRTLTVSLEG